jgi:hypothetical protein
MNAEHEKENVKEADALERGQSTPAPHHEKGAGDQKFRISQVGHSHDDRKGDAPAEGPSARSFWFDDSTKEIGDAPGSTGTPRGWVYVRTKTGHLKKRAHG